MQNSTAAEERYRLGRELADKLGATDGPSTFDLLGMTWELLPGTYAPRPGTGTEWYTNAIPYPENGRFLEIGCGAGVTAVWAAKHGCAHVTATDITASAVESAARNIVRHGVEDRVHAFRSDVFSDLDKDERYDTVFWNCSVLEAPQEFEFTRDVERAIFDRGYSALQRYLRGAHSWLAPGGRAFVTFNSLGDASRLHEVADQAGTSLQPLDSSTRELVGKEVTFKLLEIYPKVR
ncbi:methyltransferase [Streptomonospora litoralis]|uniref:Ribosomal RNA small subunit methyltransferase C n=1 Tax=Streptomonospora litoralis TaxID=2498135 RepID=A0A4P6Q479_9ACTN|nr:methyltransferase [Streptomonospora litoralis]QBI55445.1 Ribosomal RNA small subunit methyltransferase C [Streptomonospora litoralis]